MRPHCTVPHWYGVVIPYPCLINNNYRFKKFSPLLNRFKSSCMILRCVCFCMSVNACGTHHTATFFLKIYSVKIQWTVVRGILVSAFISLSSTHWSLSTTVVTTAMLVLLITVEGQPDHRLSSVLTRPFLKCLCHLWTVLLSCIAFPQTSFNKEWILETVLQR